MCFPYRITAEFADDLTPLRQNRQCDKCGGWTWWATPLQPKNGRCPSCHPGDSITIATEELYMKALTNLIDAFPAAEVVPDVMPLTPPGYVGADAGPCVACGRPCRRYGWHGRTHCAECAR